MAFILGPVGMGLVGGCSFMIPVAAWIARKGYDDLKSRGVQVKGVIRDKHKADSCSEYSFVLEYQSTDGKRVIVHDFYIHNEQIFTTVDKVGNNPVPMDVTYDPDNLLRVMFTEELDRMTKSFHGCCGFAFYLFLSIILFAMAVVVSVFMKPIQHAILWPFMIIVGAIGVAILLRYLKPERIGGVQNEDSTIEDVSNQAGYGSFSN